MSDTPPLTGPIFGRSALQKQVDLALGSIPEGKRGCILAVNAGNGWVELLTAAQIGDHWQIIGRLRHERANNSTTGSVEIRAIW